MHEAVCTSVGGKSVHWQTSRKICHLAGSGGPQKQQDNLLQTCLGLSSRWITHMAILRGVVLSWQAVAKHLWQMARKQGRKLEVTRSTIKMDLLANACCKTNSYREAGASETPAFTNCLPNHYKLSISMPAVLHQNTQSLFFDILSVCCPCITTNTSYKK